MNSRIYIGSFIEYFYEGSKTHFEIAFTKDDALRQILKKIKEICKLQYFDCYHHISGISICEFANERYYFPYEDGLVSYFNNVIRNSNNIYDDILKCIESNVFYYDIYGNFIYQEVNEPICVKTGNNCIGRQLIEDGCINGYKSDFKCVMLSGTPSDKLSCINICRLGIQIIYSCITIKETPLCIFRFFIVRYSEDELIDIINEIYEDLLYKLKNKNYDIDEIEFDDFLIDVYNIESSQNIIDKIHSITNINELKNYLNKGE